MVILALCECQIGFLGEVNASRQTIGQNPLKTNEITAYKNAVNNHLNKRVLEGMSPETVAHIAADSFINPYSKALPVDNNGAYDRNHIQMAVSGNPAGKYNTTTFSQFGDNISLRNITPRKSAEIKNLLQRREEILNGSSDGGAGVVPSSTNVGGAPFSAGRTTYADSIAQNTQKVNAFNREYEPEIQDLQNAYQKYGDDFEFNLTPEQQAAYEHLLRESPRDSEGRYIDPVTGEMTIDQIVNRSGFANPYAQNNQHTTFAGDRDFVGQDFRGENSAVNKAAFPKVQEEDLATPELEKYGIKPTRTEYNQALEYVLMEERPELFERYEKARLGLEALEENIEFNQFTPTELKRLYGKNYAEHLDRGMISQMVRKDSVNGLDQAAMRGDMSEVDMEDYINRLNNYYETKREVKDLEQEIREAYTDPELREDAKQALWFNKYEEIENAVANLRQNGVDIDFDGYVQLKYGNEAKSEAVKTEEKPNNNDTINEDTKTDKNIASEAPLTKETDQKTRKFAETVLDTDTPPKDFVKLMHAGDESLKYTPKKNSELWNKATKSV